MKKILVVVLILVVLAGAAALLLLGSLDGIVKNSVESVGSKATKAPVTLADVSLSLTEGKAELGGLVIGNPEGFETPSAFRLGKVLVDIDTESIQGDGPIVLTKVVIEAPEVTYEVGGGGTNVGAIQANVEEFVRGLGGGGGGEDSGGEDSGDGAGDEGRRIRIDKLVVKKGRVEVSATLLKGAAKGAELPALRLSDVGGQDGATSGELAGAILSALTRNVLGSVAGADLGGLEKGIEKVKEGLGGLLGR